jgi:cellulose synthase/poly-beta-1,6-N-acetylglucosamine synthase-like glycosyltransferase
MALDYPSYEIIVLDDNTTDESMWRPVEEWCLANQVTFVHLQDWPGYKSGALNYALRHLVDPRTELIGVIDSDYQLDPQFLRRCAPLFADPSVGLHPGSAGLPRLAAGAVLPTPLLLLQVLLRRVATLAQRARRRDPRRNDGADPAPRTGAGRRLGRVVHHRGR